MKKNVKPTMKHPPHNARSAKTLTSKTDRFRKGLFAITRKQSSGRLAAISLTSFLLMYALINVGLFFAFKHKTYPNTSVNNQPVGAMSFSELQDLVREDFNAPERIILSANNKQFETTSGNLGIEVDDSSLIQNARQRHWLPVVNLFLNTNIKLEYGVDETAFETTLTEASNELYVPSRDATIQLSDEAFSVQESSNGYQIDTTAARNVIIDSIQENRTLIDLPTLQQQPNRTEQDLDKELIRLNTMLNSEIVFRFGDKSQRLDKKRLASLFVAEKETYALSDKALRRIVQEYGTSFGITVGNIPESVQALKRTVEAGKSSTITLAKQEIPRRRYTYCVAVKGVSSSHLGGFKSKLRAVYADNRGWNLDGVVSFSEVSSGCNFTAWLTRADLVPSFSSSICDSTWSCRVGNNVIINFDRWSNASPAWNNGGGNLNEYRSMVINHETGHWLGFGHRFCGGIGQPAPVMQQQSINLQGCRFNAWPTQSEKSAL